MYADDTDKSYSMFRQPINNLEEAPNSEMNNIHGHSPVASFKQANFKH
jgi:hypothetical protein